MSLKKILIIDDHALFRAGLQQALRAVPATEVLQAASVDEALNLSASGLTIRPDLILLDIQLNQQNSLLRLHELRQRWPQAKVLVLSANDSQSGIDEAMRYFVEGFLSKAERTETIVLEVMRHLSLAANASSQPKLTPRQHEVLQLMGKGLSNKAIGRAMGLTENTVRWHVQFILMAFQASSRTEAVFAAHACNMIADH